MEMVEKIYLFVSKTVIYSSATLGFVQRESKWLGNRIDGTYEGGRQFTSICSHTSHKSEVYI